MEEPSSVSIATAESGSNFAEAGLTLDQGVGAVDPVGRAFDLPKQGVHTDGAKSVRFRSSDAREDQNLILRERLVFGEF